MGQINCINLLEREAYALKTFLKNHPIFDKYIAILLTTNDEPSNKYVSLKVKMLNSLGIKTKLEDKKNLNKEGVKNWVIKHNEDSSCLGIIVQYPVSSKNREEIVNLITPRKDIDALNDYWFNKLVDKKKNINKILVPPTAFGCLEIIKDQGVREANVLVIGDSLLTGKPIKLLLERKNFNLSVCNKETTWLQKEQLVKESRIIVSSVGKRNVIDEKWIKENQLVIDFGRLYINNKAYGDIEISKLNDNVTFTSLYRSTGYATLAGILRNIKICIGEFK